MAAPAFQSIRRLTADEAVRMVDAGILGKDEPVELLDGVLVEMSPQGPLHADATSRLADRLRAVYGARARVREEKPLAAGSFSLPEPDIAVVREQNYATRHPTSDDAILIVELAWTSQTEDRRKAAIYAAAGVRVYWLVDLAARKLELRTTPREGAFTVTEVLGEDDMVLLPELTVSWCVRDLLP